MQMYAAPSGITVTPTTFSERDLLGQNSSIPFISFGNSDIFVSYFPLVKPVAFAWRAFGTVQIRTAGSYQICTTSEDGSMVFMNNGTTEKGPTLGRELAVSERKSVLLIHTGWGADSVRFALIQNAWDVDKFCASYCCQSSFDQSLVPDLKQLLLYDAVLVWSDCEFAYSNLLGDVLAEYWNNGGGVVLAVFDWSPWGGGVRGTFGNIANGYILIDSDYVSYDSTYRSLGTISEPSSPLVKGVNSFQSYDFLDLGTRALLNGSTVVAYWSDGNPLIVRGKKGGRNLVQLNMFPPYSASVWSGDGGTIISNALLFSTERSVLNIHVMAKIGYTLLVDNDASHHPRTKCSNQSLLNKEYSFMVNLSCIS